MTVEFPEVTTAETGFRLAGGTHELVEVQWNNVVEIVAYKWDVFAYDVICLGFRLVGADKYIEVAEEFPGYEQFVKAVESRFALKEGWWSQVAFPAFETNWSTIWGESLNQEFVQNEDPDSDPAATLIYFCSFILGLSILAMVFSYVFGGCIPDQP